ncbi:MAG: ATP-binding protein [Bacteroidia bacterium]|nr:ATP-binding protein [Bacteroidia bacterium]
MEAVKPKKVYPDWVNELARKYFSKTISQFIVHGNINDYIHVKEGAKDIYHKLRDFFVNELFKKRDLIVFYDRATGIRFKTPEMRKDFTRALEAYDTAHGTNFSTGWPKDPVRAFALLEMYFRIRLMDGKSICFLVDYAETIVPMASASQYNPEDRNIQVFLQKWATESLFLQNDMTILLLTENIINLNTQYTQNPHNAEVLVPYPAEEDRLNFINTELGQTPRIRELLEMTPEVLAKNTAGLNLVHLKVLLAEIAENNLEFSFEDLNLQKKDIIEAEAGGLLEFVESKFSLANVAGHKEAKKHLMEAAQAIKNGRDDVMPMGYLVSGPVGTGKTFMITCFANDIGVPMVKLQNFRSKWQGESEGNLQKVLKLLEAMTPVAVMIDEADAYLGNRSGGGDSGVSSRIFSMLASFMSNTDNRGKIIWFLVTARPDLMPVDFKRQGRAEEHIALFYPETVEQKKELLEIMLKKTGLKYINVEEFDEDFYLDLKNPSGADMEAALTRAKFKAAARGEEKVTPITIMETFDDFLPPTYPDEVELMNYSAVLECTSRSLLPDRYKSLTREEIIDKVNELKLKVRG